MGWGVAKKHVFVEKGVDLIQQKTGVKWNMARKMGVTNKNVTAEKGFDLVPKKKTVDWGVAREMGVALVPQKMGVGYGKIDRCGRCQGRGERHCILVQQPSVYC